jgi:hypothetical protein
MPFVFSPAGEQLYKLVAFCGSLKPNVSTNSYTRRRKVLYKEAHAALTCLVSLTVLVILQQYAEFDH